jgi:hypothetical protein
MTYADAIRLGSTLRPQGFGLDRNLATTACADDAAKLAIGVEGASVTYFPEAGQKAPRCPRCSRHYSHIVGLVAHLNDDHQWTRNQIADWLDTVLESKTSQEVRVTRT